MKQATKSKEREGYLARLVAPILSGLLLSLAFAPFNVYPVLGFGLAPFLFALTSATGKQGWKRGYLFGLVFALGELHWLYQLAVKWTGSVGLALVPWLLAAVLMAIYFGLFGWLTARCFQANKLWPIPLLWAGVEVFRSYIPVFAFPWALLANPLSACPPLIQGAHFGTIYLVSAWIVTVNLTILEVWKGGGRKWILLGATTSFAIVSLGIYEIQRPTHPIRLTLGQTGIDMAYETDPAVTASKMSLTVKSFLGEARDQGSRLLILPEGTVHGPDGSDYFGFHLPADPPILFGAAREVSRTKVYQSAVGFDGQWHKADKTRLVIFGEFVPMRDILPLPAEFRLPSGDISAGEEGVKSVHVGGLEVGPLICFEALFPDLSYRQARNGSEFLAVMSIDDWFMNSSAPDQLRGASVWRAVETGLPVARAASLGSTLAVDGKGNVIAEAPVGAPSVLPVDLPVPNRLPFNGELPIFPVGSFLTVLGVIGWVWSRGKKV